MSHLRRWSLAGAIAAALAGGAAVAANGLARTWPLGRLPMWDAAGNGWGAVELWAALSQGHVLDFLVRLNAQDSWPFGFSLLLLPFVAGGSASFEAATLLPALAFAVVPAVLVWAGWEIERGARGPVAGLIAGALWLAAPLARALGAVVMRETAGAALSVAVLAAYLRGRRRDSLGAWRGAGSLALLLLFVKANYFLLVAAALALHAWLELDLPVRRGLLREVAARVLREGWRSAPRWGALAVLVAVASLAAGLNPGTFLFAVIWIATIAVGLTLARRRPLPRPSGMLARWSPSRRALVETLVAPVWIWCLSPWPIHPRNLIAFLRNRPGEGSPFSLDALAFYPLSLFNDYFPQALLAWMTALFALAALALLLRRGDRARAAAFCALFGTAAVVAHPYKQGRFLATIVPFLFLVAALAAVRVAARRLPERPAPRVALASALVGAALVGIWGGATSAPMRGRVERDVRALTAAPAFRQPLDDLSRRLSAPVPSGFLGGFNVLSEDLVRWDAWRQSGREATLAPPLRGLDGSAGRDLVRERVDAWVERSGLRRVVAVRPLPGSPWLEDRDYLRYNAWQLEAMELLAGERGLRRRARRVYPALGLELFTLESRPPRSANARRSRRPGRGRGASSPDRR